MLRFNVQAFSDLSIAITNLFIAEFEHKLTKKSTLSSDDEFVAEERPILANEFKVHEGITFAQLP